MRKQRQHTQTARSSSVVVCLSNSVPPNPNANLEAVQRRWMLNLSRVMIYSENFAEWPGEEEEGGGIKAGVIAKVPAKWAMEKERDAPLRASE